MEMMDQSLFHLLQDRAIELSWQKRLKMAYDISAGLVYLHVERQTIHRDIKSLNILVKGHGAETKIADFGASRGASSFISKKAGTHRWVAPELYHNEPPTFAVDIYALGITLNELLTRQIPFIEFGDNDMAIMRAVDLNQRPTMDAFPTADLNRTSLQSYSQLIQQCWDQDPLQRPSATLIQERLFSMLHPVSTSSSSSPSSSSSTPVSSIAYGEYSSNDITFHPPPPQMPR